MDTIEQREKPIIDMVISRVRDDSSEAQVRCVYNAIRAFRITSAKSGDKHELLTPTMIKWVAEHRDTIIRLYGKGGKSHEQE